MSNKNVVRGAGTPAGNRALDATLGLHSIELSASLARFADGAQMRVEIPSVENPVAMAAVIEEADRHAVTVHRVSQGSGAMLLSEKELSEMAAMGSDRGIEVSLFVGPREEFGTGGAVHASEGRSMSGHLRGLHQLRYALEDIHRALESGIRGFLIADLGLLEVVNDLVLANQLPSDIVWKTSAVLAPSNPVSFRQLAKLGASTINIPSDMTLLELCEVRAASEIPIDIYMEAPDSLGGMVRGHEIVETVLVAAPLYAKYGLRNARAVYPAGQHLSADVVANVREKVRRAAISIEWIKRSESDPIISLPGAKGLGVPLR
jgi:hypothetical protein